MKPGPMGESRWHFTVTFATKWEVLFLVLLTTTCSNRPPHIFCSRAECCFPNQFPPNAFEERTMTLHFTVCAGKGHSSSFQLYFLSTHPCVTRAAQNLIKFNRKVLSWVLGLGGCVVALMHSHVASIIKRGWVGAHMEKMGGCSIAGVHAWKDGANWKKPLFGNTLCLPLYYKKEILVPWTII